MLNKKRTLITVLIALLLALVFTVSAAANAMGDVDNDGDVKAGDARLALRASVKLEDFWDKTDDVRFKASDTDADGKITANDARKILRVAVKLDKFDEQTEPTPDNPSECAHEWSAWAPEKNDKNVNTGYHTRTCSKCKKTEREACTYETEKHPQNPKNPGPATCTTSYTWYQRCTACNAARVGTDPALNHKNKVLVEDKCVAPTCTEAGYEWYSCPDCGKDGDSLDVLKVALKALGHDVASDKLTVDSDIICARCGKTIMPSFNSLVSVIKKTDGLKFSNVTKQDSSGVVKNANIKIAAAAKALMAMMPEEDRMTEEDIINGFTEEMNNPESTYVNYRLESPFLYWYYPLPETDEVSHLRSEDLTGIHVEEIDKIDFLADIPDAVEIKVGSGTRNIQLDEYKALGNTTGDILKVTLDVKTEKYSEVKGLAEDQETALQRAMGKENDIRKYPLVEDNSEEGFEIKMTTNEIVSDCTVTYYFLKTTETVEGEEKTTYTPLASIYYSNISLDEHIDLKASFAITEGGTPIDIVSGSIDMTVSNAETTYYIFSK